MSFEKSNGIYYTPKLLADLIAKLAIEDSSFTIFDPCFGNGRLLEASYTRLRKLGCNNPESQLFGLDINPNYKQAKNEFLKLLGNNLKTKDFFSVPDEPNETYDVLLMNPPYIRHHLINEENKEKLRVINWGDISIPNTSDMWVYFIIHSYKLLNTNGTFAAILPWSFLQSDYSKVVKTSLLEKFASLKTIIIGKQLFNGAEERVLILVGNGFGKKNKNASISYIDDVRVKRIRWKPISRETLLNNPAIGLEDNIGKTLTIIQNKGFLPLDDFTDIKIGTVTGANNFFVLKREQLKDINFPDLLLKPILRRSQDIKALTIPNSDKINDYLLLIPEDYPHSDSIRDYIKRGEDEGISKRYHAKNREVWYSIPSPNPPDGFLSYMTKEIPFISLNPNNVLSTNTIHQLFFKEYVDDKMKKWIQISMFSSISQLSVELHCRTYGGGVLKIEPTAAGKILVYTGNSEKISNSFIKKINKLLSDDKKNEVMKLVDQFFVENNVLSRKQIDIVSDYYSNLRSRRLGI